MSIEVSGYNNWLKLANTIANRAEHAVQSAAEAVYNYADAHVAVDTGELKDSGHIEPGENRWTKYVVYGTDHCLFVEYGTRFMRAQPYLQPAMENVGKHWERLLTAVFDVSGL